MANPPSRHSIISLLIKVWDEIERQRKHNPHPFHGKRNGWGFVHLHIHADIFIPIKHPEFVKSVFTLYAK